MSPIRSFCFLLVCAGAVACAQSGPGRAPFDVGPVAVPAAKIRTTDKFIVITDASLTMFKRGHFDEARALTQSLVRAMPERSAPARNPGSYDASLIAFGGRERVGTGLDAFNRGALDAAAGDLEPIGSLTPLHKVINEVSMALDGKSGRAALVIFSDGLPDDEDRAIATAQSLAKTYPGDVCIHTVQTGSDAEGSAFLKRLSSVTPCGSSRMASVVSSASSMSDLSADVFLGPAPALPQVAAAPCSTRIVLRGINFAFDSSEVSDDDALILDTAIHQLTACPDARFSIEGHTDSIGTPEYNQGLSDRRAETVRRYLIRGGIDAARLSARGIGEENPVGDNQTRDGRAQNRRVSLSPTY